MSTTITLELGDIVEIYSPDDIQYHENVFFINYIDTSLIKLTSINNGSETQLTLNEGKIDNMNIKQIFLLDRNEDKGYVKQNKLDVGKWVNIHFGGDYPTILTGQITNSEEDMIEITSYPDLQTIYIDFEYKGVPENIPLKQIEIREPPQEYLQKETLDKIEESEYQGSPISDKDDIELQTPLSVEDNDNDNYEDELLKLYDETNEIVFGEKLETLKQVVEVPEHEKKYNIEVQLNDMMDVFLSTIPNQNRTETIMKNVHLLITRFKELRETFSSFSESNNSIVPRFYGPYYKPLVENMKNMNTKLKWLLPVVKHKKRVIYSNEVLDVDIEASSRNSLVEFRQIQELQEKYKKDEKYQRDTIVQRLNNILSHIGEPDLKDDVYATTVNAGIEAVVDNLNDFYSTVLQSRGETKFTVRNQYVIDTYSLGMKKSIASRFDNKVNILVNNTQNDSIYTKSFLYLPHPFIEQSKIYLNKQNMLERVKTHQNLMMYSRLFNNKTNIINNVIENLDEDYNHDSLDLLTNLNTFSLDDFSTNVDKNVRFEKFCESIVPKTKALINILREQLKNKYTFVSIVKELEPFSISQQHITYTQHNSIRYNIKENIKEYKKRMIEFSQLFSNYMNNRRIHERALNMDFFDSLLDTQAKTIIDNYLLPSKNTSVTEQIKKIYNIDNAKLLYTFVSKLMFALNAPSKLNILDEQEKNTNNPLRIKSDCSRRFLSKKYNNVNELMKDNNKDVLYYDKEYDDTPYDIMENYQTENRSMVNEDFHEFLKEVLMQKHDVQKDYVEVLTRTLLEGKKQVDDQDYAIVENVESDNNIHYYKRVKNNWVRDDTISDTIFMDNNTLFCNIQKQCVKNTTNQMCQSNEQMKESLKNMRKEELLQELETRYHVNMDELNEELEKNFVEYQRYMKKQMILNEVIEQKANNLSYHIGLLANKDLSIKSPHSSILQKILSSTDFTTKQNHIVLFVGLFCREPIETTNENLYWKYCKDSNVKLIPSFLYELAHAFALGNYEEKLFEIIRKQGVESDDGESIVDMHSGMIITPRTFDTEEGFDALGFKVSSRTILQDEITQIPEQRKITRAQQRIFENPHMEKIYKVFEFLTTSMDVDGSVISDMCLRVSLELVESLIKGKDAYEKIVEKQKQKNPDKKLAKYQDYFNESLIMIVSGCYLISLQTAIPSIKSKKTFPGCVKSFSGYPMGGDEDTSGLKYISCVLYKTRSNIDPWSSVKKYKSSETFEKNIRKIIDTHLITNSEITHLIKEKKQYLLLNKDDDYEIKEQHSIQRWVNFQPPLIKYELTEEQKNNVSKEFFRELLLTIQKGDKSQHNMLYTLIAKNTILNYGIIQEINNEVSKEKPILKTFGGIPFVDNACCQDIIKNPLKYFSNKNENINVYLTQIKNNEDFIANIRMITTAPIMYHPYNTRAKTDITKQGHYEENIYGYVIHYCNFDKPERALSDFESICGEIPKSYQPELNIEEKIAILKRNGKNYNLDSLFGLMKMINKRNTIHSYIQNEHNYSKDILNELDNFEELEIPIIEKPLIDLLRSVVSSSNGLQNEETKDIENLKNYLLMTTQRMDNYVLDYVRRFSNEKKKNFGMIQKFISELREPNMWQSGNQENYHKISYLLNYLQYISKTMPQIIARNMKYTNVPGHWKLASEHEDDIKKFVLNEYKFMENIQVDDTMKTYLNVLQENIEKIYNFCLLFPYTDYDEKYLVLDKRSQELFISYCIYSVLYEYIVLTDNEDIIHIHLESTKREIRKTNAATESDEIVSMRPNVDNELQQQMEVLEEVEVLQGNRNSLKNNVCNILVALLNKGIYDKGILNINYGNIIKKTQRSKDYEKKQIIKYLGKMSIEQRRIEDEHKKYKLGMWNVGQQKGMIRYDVATYRRERNEIIKMIDGENEGDGISEESAAVSMLQNVYTIQDLEEHDANIENEMQEREAYDISHLDENFMDGNYYPEDNEEDN